MTGSVCLIIITFNNFFISRQILENILLLLMFVGVLWMWFMVNQVRQDIRDKRNMNRQEEKVEIELVEVDDKFGEQTDSLLETLEHPIEID